MLSQKILEQKNSQTMHLTASIQERHAHETEETMRCNRGTMGEAQGEGIDIAGEVGTGGGGIREVQIGNGSLV